MLLRCCKTYITILLAMTTAISAGSHLDPYQKQGKALGKSFKFVELSPDEVNSLTPIDLRGQQFDGEQARQQLKGTKKSRD